MKQMVDVVCVHYTSGHIKPLWIIWEDGMKYMIDKVVDIRKAASLKSGGVGIRYKCRIKSSYRYLFLEDNKWFIERCDY